MVLLGCYDNYLIEGGCTSLHPPSKGVCVGGREGGRQK